MSFAARMGWFVFFSLLAIVVVFWFVLRHDGDVPWQQTLTIERVLVGVLLLVIPFVTRKVVLSWIHGVTPEFEDIQDAWKRGLAALREHNIGFESHPIFLLLGSGDLRQEKSLMAAARLPYVVEAVPPGPAPIHFYATADAIYIMLSDASWLSGLIRLANQQADGETLPITRWKPDEAALGTIQPPPDEDQMWRRTLDASTFAKQKQMLDDQQPSPAMEENSTLKPKAMSNWSGDKPVKLTPQEAIDQTRRIRHVAQLIRSDRHPLCPINGIACLMPFSILTASEGAVREVQRAIRSDLVSLQEALTLRAPTVALFTGLENEDGFRELVRRVGPVGAARQRFGQGMDVRCHATVDELEAVADHACGAFEDWVYTLFREDGSLTHPGNTKLHSLLCTVRSSLKRPIGDLLMQGFGTPDGDMETTPIFAGCYFAATGSSEDQQAFVRGVFDKLAELQEDLEWTSKAWTASRRSKLLFYTGMACCIALTLTLMALIVTKVS